MMHTGNTLVYSIAGYSKSGKTTLITELISKLKDKGYRIATMKDCPKDLTLDTEGKDTWKHKKAGAELAVLTTNLESTILFAEPQEMDRIIELIKFSVHPDIILVEGHKRSALPKIWVPGEDNKGEGEKVEDIVYEYEGNIATLVEFIEKELRITEVMNRLGGSDCGKCGFDTCHELAVHVMTGENDLADCQELPEDYKVELTSAGEPVQLNKFATNIIAGTITGMAKELKGVKDPESIEIKISKR